MQKVDIFFRAHTQGFCPCLIDAPKLTISQLEVPERLVVVDPRRLPPGEPRADLNCARGGDEGRGGFAAVVLHHSVLGGSCDCGCCVALSISVAVNICADHRAA